MKRACFLKILLPTLLLMTFAAPMYATPDAFSFIDQSGMPLSTEIVSNPITVTGISSPEAISIANGEYSISINGGSTWGGWTSAEGTVNLNDQVKVSLTSSASYSTLTTATLTIGGVSDALDVTTAAAGDPNATGLISWWKADNNAYDSVGGNHGTLQDGTIYASGNVGQAFSFDGSSDSITVDDSSFPAGNSDRSVSLWIKTSQTDEKYYFSYGPNITNQRFSLGMSNNRFCIENCNSGSRGSSIINDNGWHHLIAVWSSSSLKMYVDGAEQQITVLTPWPAELQTGLTGEAVLGRISVITGYDFNGLIDEIKLFNRALSASEASKLAGAYPDSFSFIDQTGMPLSTVIVSNPITVTGIDVASAISVTDGEYAISADGGSTWGGWTSTDGTVSLNDQVKVQRTSSASYSTLTTATLTVGGVSDAFDVTTAVADVPNATGLVSWWKADNNTYDSVGGNHGTLQDGTTYASGNVGQAFSFDGSSDYVTVGDSSFPAGNSDRSVSLWIKTSQTDEKYFFSYGADFANQRFSLGMSNNRFHVENCHSGSHGNSIINDNEWHHLIAVWSSSSLKMYVDGVEQQITVVAPWPAELQTVLMGEAVIGRVNLYTAYDFNGLVDEVKLFNRALSASEASKLAGTYPDSFSFIDQTGVPLSIVIVSNPITVIGIDVASAISVTDGEYAISADGGSTWGGWTSTDGMVSLNDQVKVQRTSSASYSTLTTATLTVGGVSDAFNVTTAAADDPNATGLVSWWKAENNAFDSVGGNHGAWSGTSAYAAGQAGQAFNVNGSSYIATADSPVWDLGTDDFTIDAWVSTPTPGSTMRLLSAGSHADGTYNVWALGYGEHSVWGSGNRLNFAYYSGAPYVDISSDQISIPADTLCHITLVRAGADLRFYCNGAPAGTRSIGPVSLGGGSTGAIIGARYYETPSSIIEYASGRIDEVRLFRRALSEGEVNTLGGTKPDAISFIDQTDAPLGTPVESNAITVTGNANPAPISITGGEYVVSTDGGSTWGGWTSTTGTVSLNDQVKVRQTSASSYESTTDATLTIGGVSDTFSVTTMATALIPIPVTGLRIWLKADAGVIKDGSNQTSSWNDQSGNGFNVAQGNVSKQPLFVDGAVSGKPVIRCDGGDDYLQTASPVNLFNGTGIITFIAVVKPGPTQKTYAAIFDYTHNGVLGTVFHQNMDSTNEFATCAGTWQKLDVASYQVFSSIIANGSGPITYLNGGNQKIGTPISTNFNDPNYFTVGNKSLEEFSRQFNGDVAEIIIYNTVMSDADRQAVENYLLTKYAIDLAPDAFSFTDQTGVARSTSVESNVITVSAINSPTEISITGGDYAISTDNGSTWGGWTGTAGIVNLNNKIKVQVTSSSEFETANSATLIIGGVSDTFSVTTAPDIVTPTITVTSPNGGENWIVGSSHEITWTSTGIVGVINIVYTTDGGSSWNAVVSGTDNDGSYTWTIPNAPSTNCRVQVSEGADDNPADQSDALFTIAASTYAISGNVTWSGSPLANVAMNGLPGNPVTNSSGFYTAVVDYGWSGTVTPARQYFTFTPASTTYTSISASQTTNYAAALTQSLVVDSPNSTSLWEKGKTYSITWLKQGTQNANIKIMLYKGISTLVKTLATKTLNDGSYDWLVPTTLAVGTYFIRVQTVDNLIKDDSDKFSIIVPTITVTAPTTGTIWVKNAAKTITWTKLGTQDANVKIQLYMGTTKKLDITLSTPNNGTYAWPIPSTLANGAYTIRVTTLDGKVKGVSKAFTIAAGMIKVIAPATGAKWFRGMPWDITWISEGAVNGNVKIQLFKGTTKVLDISPSTPTVNGIYNWTIPAAQAVATNYSIKITALDNLVSGKTGLFSIVPGTMAVTAPTAGTIWQRGLPHIITWTKQGTLLNANVKIQLYKGTTLVSTMAATTPNDGSYEWTIAAAQALAANYKVRVTTVDNLVQANSGAFTISNSVGFRLTSPNGEEMLKASDPYKIRWTADPNVLEVKLEFSRDNGGSFATIADHLEDTGSYDWIVPVNFTRNGIVRVSDSNGRSWIDDGLLEFSFKFNYGGEGEGSGAVVWFGSNDPKAASYGFGKIDIGNDAVGFGGLTRAIAPLAGDWHEMRVRFDFRRDTADVRLDDQPLFENAALNTTREHCFQPSLVLQTGGDKVLEFMIDDLAVNVVQLDSAGDDQMRFNALSEDFDRYDERSNALGNCWQLPNANNEENKVQLNVADPKNKSLQLKTESGKQLMIWLPFALPAKVPFDISDKCLVIENR